MPWTWTDTLIRPKQRKRDNEIMIRISGYTVGYVVQKGHGDYIFFFGKGNENRELGTDFLYLTEYYQQLRE